MIQPRGLNISFFDFQRLPPAADFSCRCTHYNSKPDRRLPPNTSYSYNFILYCPIQINVHTTYINSKYIRRDSNITTPNEMEHLESQECSINHLELHNRVRQWLEESPDIRPKQEDLLTSKHWSISRHSISVASYTHLEDWEDESLFEALHYPNGSSGVLSCFRGMFRKSK